MRKPKTDPINPAPLLSRWSRRDLLAAAALFLASAAVVLWQNAHLCILWDASYTLDTSFRIALGQMPYRDFPLVHSPLTFLIQAAIMRLTGRVFFHHILYAAIVNGLATVLAWRIVLHTLRGRLLAAWPVSLLLAAPLVPLGVYSILPFPSYDCDTAFSILIVVFLLQRLPESSTNSFNSRLRFFFTGIVLPLPLFFKQNIGLPFLAAAIALIFLLLFLQRLRRNSTPHESPATLSSMESDLSAGEIPDKPPAGAKAQPLLSVFCGTTEVVPCYKTRPLSSDSAACLAVLLAGALVTLCCATLVLHFTAGVRNHLHWTIQFASERRLPGLQPMLAIYAEPSLLWWLPCVAAALLLLRSRFRWFRLTALLLFAAPFLWTLISLALSSDSEDRTDSLLALWPLLLILSAALSLWNLYRWPSLRAGIPILILAAMQGTFLSQQLWGSTYAIWPLLMLLIAEMIAFLASIEQPATAAPVQPCKLFLILHRRCRPTGHEAGVGEDAHTTAGLETGATGCFLLVPSLAAIIAATLLICGGLYTASEERLSYAQLPDGPALHSTIPALKGMAVSGPYLPEFEELLQLSAKEIPFSDGLILIPGEDPFYFATGRAPQFPVLLFDNATDPLSTPALLVAEADRRQIRWLIVKRNLQIKEDVTPQREATLQALQQIFRPYHKLAAYDVYRRP